MHERRGTLAAGLRKLLLDAEKFLLQVKLDVLQARQVPGVFGVAAEPGVRYFHYGPPASQPASPAI